MSKQNVFSKYLSKKYKQQDISFKNAGPVITISREFGCSAGRISEKIVRKINDDYNNNIKWTWISKEILAKAASELQTKPEHISYFFDAQKKSFLEDIAESFIKSYYVSDSQITIAVTKVIKSSAIDGNIIIVGRSSCAILKNIVNSLHIKLYAPIDFRVKQISNRFNISEDEALEMIIKTDKKRNTFMKFFIGNNRDIDLYDIMLNCSKYNEEQIVNIIIKFAEDKNLI